MVEPPRRPATAQRHEEGAQSRLDHGHDREVGAQEGVELTPPFCPGRQEQLPLCSLDVHWPSTALPSPRLGPEACLRACQPSGFPGVVVINVCCCEVLLVGVFGS